MEQIYYDLVTKGLKTIEEVPAKLRAAVQAMIDNDRK